MGRAFGLEGPRMLKLMSELGFGISGAEVLEGLRLFVVVFFFFFSGLGGLGLRQELEDFKGDMDSDLGVNWGLVFKALEV